jgi:hypothetical protein
VASGGHLAAPREVVPLIRLARFPARGT